MALLIERKGGEVVHVGDARILVEFRGAYRVVLVIDAPRDVPVRRGELEPRPEPLHDR